jgi:predicted nucleotidyltransferase
MKPSEALQAHRAELRQLASRHGVLSPRVFGSVVHSEDRDGSNLDLLVACSRKIGNKGNGSIKLD